MVKLQVPSLIYNNSFVYRYVRSSEYLYYERKTHSITRRPNDQWQLFGQTA